MHKWLVRLGYDAKGHGFESKLGGWQLKNSLSTQQ